MLKSILSRFVVLDTFKVEGTQLQMRFVPDYFDIQQTNPIILIRVDLAEGVDEVGQKLARIQSGLVDDIETNESNLSISIESSESPINFSGSITWSYEEYSLSDHVEAIQLRDRFISEQQDEIRSLRLTIKGAVRFLEQTVARIERKRGLTQSKETGYTKQIELLERVRRKLDSPTS